MARHARLRDAQDAVSSDTFSASRDSSRSSRNRVSSPSRRSSAA